ncbi:MAG: 3'-5' exonuclease [Bacteroidota bacterium]
MFSLQQLFGRKPAIESGPTFLKTYYQSNFSGSKQLPIDEAVFCVLDCETTGLDKNDRIITVGAVKVHRSMISVGDALDLRLGSESGNASAEVHEELSFAPEATSAEFLEQFLVYLNNAIIVGHNVAFDIGKLNQWLSSHFKGCRLKNKVLDTFNLMKRLDVERMNRMVAGHDSFQLDKLCEEFNIPVENRHTALGDAYLTAQVFMHQVNLLQKRGVKTLGALMNTPSF